MGNSIYGIAISALNAAQVGLSTTGHNIANANTEGYNRQKITQGTTSPQPLGTGFVGRGVEIKSVDRVYNEYLDRQVQYANAQDGFFTSLDSHLRDLDSVLADPSAGFSPSLQDYFRGIQTVANDPTSAAARQSLLGLSESMVTKLQTINDRFNTLRNDVNSELSATVSSINTITGQIAQLNDQIAITSGQTTGSQPNDLLDTRDQLINDLNRLVKATVVKQSDGSFNVFVGNGQNLVVGNQAFTLGTVAADDDPERMEVAYKQFGSTAVIPSNLLTGGSLGAVLQFRRDVLDVTQNALGRVAMGLAQTINNQQRQGQDANGRMGGNFFKMPLEQESRSYGLGDGTQVLTASLGGGSDAPFIESDFNIRVSPVDGSYTITRITDNEQVVIPEADALVGLMDPNVGQQAFGVAFKLSGPMNLGEQVGISFRPAASSVTPNTKNTGNAQVQVSISDVNKLTTSDYEFMFDGPDYRVVRKSDNMSFAISGSQWARPPVEVDGMRFQVNAGILEKGDRFLIKPTGNFASTVSVAIKDTAKIAAAAPIRTTSDTFAFVASKTPASAGTISMVTVAVEAQGGAAAKRVNLVFTSDTTYDIRDANTNATLATNQTFDPAIGQISYNDWTASITDALSGDQYTVDPRRNGGNAEISAGRVNGAPANALLKDPVAVVFDSPTSFELRNPATGEVLQASSLYTSGGGISYNGWTIEVSGTVAVGDTFLVGPNSSGVADNRNILLMGQLQTQNTLAQGSSNFQSAYSKMVSEVGVQANQARINQSAQSSLLLQAQTKVKESSGVNLDEEASNLLIFQQAYLASSRTIQIAQKIFEEILNIGR